jgi:hypothetical protein
MGNLKELYNKNQNNSNNIDNLVSVDSKLISINFKKNIYLYETDWILTYPIINKIGVINLIDFPEKFINMINIVPIVKPQGTATYDSTEYLALIPKFIHTIHESSTKYVIKYYMDLLSYTISGDTYYPYYKILLSTVNPNYNYDMTTNKQ